MIHCTEFDSITQNELTCVDTEIYANAYNKGLGEMACNIKQIIVPAWLCVWGGGGVVGVVVVVVWDWDMVKGMLVFLDF